MPLLNQSAPLLPGMVPLVLQHSVVLLLWMMVTPNLDVIQLQTAMMVMMKMMSAQQCQDPIQLCTNLHAVPLNSLPLLLPSLSLLLSEQ